MTHANLYNCTKATSLNKQRVSYVNNKTLISRQHECLDGSIRAQSEVNWNESNK